MDEQCIDAGCSGSATRRGLCERHYRQARRKGLVGWDGTPCQLDGCTQPAVSRGLCDAHYKAALSAERSACSVEGCARLIFGGDLCQMHYMRRRRKGSTDDVRLNARGVCSVEDCGRPHAAAGLCRRHWEAPHRRAVLIQEKEANPRRCAYAECQLPIDPTKRRRGPVSYCSRVCKEKAWIASGQNAIAARKSYLKRRYGLTPEQVEQMATAGCSICETTVWNGRHSRPHVDHDHATGKVRGILCSECNTGLGKFKDDLALLRAAIRYLEGASAPA